MYMPVMSFDTARVRGLYPTLGAGTAHLEGSFGALQPESVIRAIISTLRSSPAQPGSRSPRSQRSAASVFQARRAVADLVGSAAEDIVLGQSVPALLTRLAMQVSPDLRLGDEIVLNRADSDAVVLPWMRAARTSGGVVRWAELDLETGELPAWQYEQLVTGRTRVVTVPLANPAVGYVPDVRAIADIAHQHGALVVVDAGAALPHVPVDLAELGADVIALSAAAFGGPTVAALAARPGLLAELRSVPGAIGLEFGPLPVELLDGLTAAIDHLATLSLDAQGTRRERIRESIRAAAAHEGILFDRLIEELRDLPGVALLGTTAARLPMAAFAVSRFEPDQVGDHLLRHGVSVWTGPSGLAQLMAASGADELGGMSYVGLMPYSTKVEVDQFLLAMASLSSSRR